MNDIRKMSNFKVLAVLSAFVFSLTTLASIRIAISSAPSNLSPFFSTDANGQNINRLVHLSLVDFDKDMKPICILCKSYEERMEGEKHIISFKLKDDKHFWDGDKVDADAVKKSWELFTSTKIIKSIFRFAFGNIEEVRIKNNYHVELVYKKYGLDNLSNLTLFKIIKIKNEEKLKEAERPKVEDIVGAGEYQFGEVSELGVEIINNSDKKKNIVFKVVKDETTLALKLLNKEIELSLANLSPRKVTWLKNNSKGDIKIWERTSSNFSYINMNHKRGPFVDIKVREAVSKLIPKEDLKKYKLKGTVVLASSMFSKAFDGLYLGDAMDSYDPKKAQSLLTQAGYIKKDGYLWKNGEKFEINWKVSNNKAAIEIVETIKKYLENAGIKVNVTVQEWGTFMRGYKRGDFDLVMGRWIGFTGPDMLKYVFHSSSLPPKGGNRGYFVNDEFDKYIDLASTEIKAKKRNNYYKSALEIANREYSYINLWHPNVIWVSRSCIEDIELLPNGSFGPLSKIVNRCK